MLTINGKTYNDDELHGWYFVKTPGIRLKNSEIIFDSLEHIETKQFNDKEVFNINSKMDVKNYYPSFYVVALFLVKDDPIKIVGVHCGNDKHKTLTYEIFRLKE